jgi:hypothetical protein
VTELIRAALPQIVASFIEEAQENKSCAHARFLFDVWRALGAPSESGGTEFHWAEELINRLEPEQRTARETMATKSS